MTTRSPKRIHVDEALRSRLESIVMSAHDSIYLVSFNARTRHSARMNGAVRINVTMQATIAGHRTQVWLGVFSTLCVLSDADLASLVRAKIAQREAKLCPLPEFTMQRQRDSVAMIVCPVCHVQNWADKDMLEAIQADKAFPVCPVCGVLCVTGTIPEGTPEPLTVGDLDRVILAGTGVTAKDATHQEFDAWAETFMAIMPTETVQWRPQQRADFCDLLLMQGKIEVSPRMIKEDL